MGSKNTNSTHDSPHDSHKCDSKKAYTPYKSGFLPLSWGVDTL